MTSLPNYGVVHVRLMIFILAPLKTKPTWIIATLYTCQPYPVPNGRTIWYSGGDNYL